MNIERVIIRLNQSFCFITQVEMILEPAQNNLKPHNFFFVFDEFSWFKRYLHLTHS